MHVSSGFTVKQISDAALVGVVRNMFNLQFKSCAPPPRLDVMLH